jgi:hypothetical protein
MGIRRDPRIFFGIHKGPSNVEGFVDFDNKEKKN